MKILKIWIAAFVLLALVTSWARAQPGRNEIISSVSITDQSECAILRIEFELPMKYKKHFPEQAGRELRVYVDPVAVTVADRQMTRRNESIAPPDSDIVAITDIIYDGEEVVEPYLTVFFAHPMRFQVRQGSDVRMLEILVFLPSSTTECLLD